MSVDRALVDEVDPVPRMLRIIAAVVSSEPDTKALPERLVWAARVLEGAPLKGRDCNRAVGRLLAKERRVDPPPRGRRKGSPAKKDCEQPLSG